MHAYLPPGRSRGGKKRSDIDSHREIKLSREQHYKRLVPVHTVLTDILGSSNHRFIDLSMENIRQRQDRDWQTKTITARSFKVRIELGLFTIPTEQRRASSKPHRPWPAEPPGLPHFVEGAHLHVLRTGPYELRHRNCRIENNGEEGSDRQQHSMNKMCCVLCME